MAADLIGAWQFGRKLTLAGAMGALAMTLASCGDVPNGQDEVAAAEEETAVAHKGSSGWLANGPGGVGDIEVPKGIHLRPDVTVVHLSDELAPHVVIDEAAMTARLTGPALAELKRYYLDTGDVLMGPNFIYTMRDGRPDGDGFILDLKQFALLDAIWGEWDYTYQADLVTGQLLNAQAGEGMPADDSVRVLQQHLTREVNVPFSGLGDVRAGVKASGSIEFPASWQAQLRGKIAPINYNLDYTCESYIVRDEGNIISRWFGSPTYTNRVVQPRDFCIDYLLVKGNVGVKIAGEATLTAEYQREYKKEGDKTFGTLDIPLGSTPFTVKLTPKIIYGVEALAYGKTQVGFRAESQVTMPLGFEFTRATDEFSLLPNARHPISRTSSGTAWASLHVGSKVLLYSKLNLAVALGSRALPGFSLHGLDATAGIYGEGKYRPIQLNSTTTGNALPCLEAELYGKVDGRIRLAAEFKFTDLFKFNWTLGERNATLVRHPFWAYRSAGSERCLNAPIPNLTVASTWQTDTDLDLYVKTPTGEILHYRDRESTDGGVFNGDACISGNCPGVRTETATWSNPPLAGNYEVWMVNAGGRNTGSYTIRVGSTRGQIHVFSGTVGSTSGASSTRHTFRL